MVIRVETGKHFEVDVMDSNTGRRRNITATHTQLAEIEKGIPHERIQLERLDVMVYSLALVAVAAT